jgi:cysteinyl-tRNA synthetase
MFPHHENERAQAEGAGHPFARHWIHSGMVTIGDEKMAKSAGNFVTTTEALDQFGPAAFRFAVLQTHYTRSMDLGPSELDAAAKGVERLQALVRRAAAAGVDTSGATLDQATVRTFRDAMDDDFNTPNAMAAVFDAAGRANRAIDEGDLAGAASLVATVLELTGAVGLELGRESASGTDDDAEIDDLVRRRDEARAAKDFATADALRDDLTARGIQLEDTPGGTIWHR